MLFQVNVLEEISWVDTRLKYEDKNGINQYFKNSRIDMSGELDRIWKPIIAYTELSDSDLNNLICFLYPNGTVVIKRQVNLKITCLFDYEKIPGDQHDCQTTAYIMNEFTDTAILQFSDVFLNSAPVTYTTWKVTLSEGQPSFIRYKTAPEGYSSGLTFTFHFHRVKQFLMKLFIVPSILFVILAYCSFYINKMVAPARVTLCVTNILNAISLLGNSQKYIPDVPYGAWLTQFMTWNMIYTVVPMIQYALLNAAITYNA